MGWRTQGRTWGLLKPLARSMRLDCTGPERLLWLRLRHRQLGWTFRRQFVIGRFVADFFCSEARLVVEVDGAVHASRLERDAERDAWMRARGLRVVRVGNEDIVLDPDAVVHAIRTALEQPSCGSG